jgi:hypothetical protein
VHARVEDAICAGKDTGICKFPSQSLEINKAWMTAALAAATLLAWLRLLALDGDLAKAEPKLSAHSTGHPVTQRHRHELHDPRDECHGAISASPPV